MTGRYLANILNARIFLKLNVPSVYFAAFPNGVGSEEFISFGVEANGFRTEHFSINKDHRE